MKPFNLQEALAGKPVVTRDGRKVLQIAHFPKANDPIRAQIEGSGHVTSFTEKGTFYSVNQSDSDLFMESTKYTRYINLFRYRHGTGLYGADRFSGQLFSSVKETEQEAQNYPSYIVVAKAVPITWEE